MANVKYITIEDIDYPIEDNATRTASKVVVTDANGKLTTSSYDSDELATKDYVDGLIVDAIGGSY